MIDAPVYERVSARRTLRGSNKLIRRRAETEVEKSMIGGGNSAPQVNLARRTDGAWRDQLFHLLK
jgi:hypothetical protein